MLTQDIIITEIIKTKQTIRQSNPDGLESGGL